MNKTDKMNRRDFFSESAKITAATTLSMAALIEKSEAKDQHTKIEPPGFIIDSHIHCGGSEQWVADMVKIYKPYKAMACVLTWIRDLDLMIEAIKEHSDLFIGYGRVNLDDPNAVREIEKFKDHNFVGMKFHSPQKNYDDPSYFHVYRLCEEFKMHMLFHTGISAQRIKDSPQWGSSARMRPIYLDTICRQFPRVTIQGAHLGNPWYEEAAETARWNPKLFFDITGSTLLKFMKLGHLKKLSDILWWAADESENNPHTLKGGPSAWEHILFATDEKPTGLEANINRFQMMLETNNVPEKDRKNMWGLTIANILGIDPKTRKIKSN